MAVLSNRVISSLIHNLNHQTTTKKSFYRKYDQAISLIFMSSFQKAVLILSMMSSSFA